MKYRYLGPEKLEVSAVGYGCPTFSGKLPGEDERRALDVLHRAVEVGMTYIDTADHNHGNNEELLALAFKEGGWRNKIVLATKVGKLSTPDADGRTIDGRPAYLKKALENCLQRLQTDRVDLLTLHRVDPQVAIEESVGALKNLVQEGKVLHVGMSEASVRSLQRAMNEHPITAVQSEYSLMTRDYEADVIPACRELGIGFVAYYPTGRGFLSGKFRKLDDLDPGEARKNRALPKFQGENLERNLRLLDQLRALAKEKGCTPAQLSLRWLLAQGDFIVPIPGTNRIQHLEENATVCDIQLTDQERDRISELFAPTNVAGERFNAERMKELNI